MLLMLAGDTHGDFKHLTYLITECVSYGIKVIFVLGDFGYWEHTSSGKLFLDDLNVALRREGIDLIFLDGNHENHPLLWESYESDRDDGFVEIRSSIFYSPRGHRWEWDGVKFLSLGGAYSIDKDWREAGTEWWPTEMITDEDVERCGTEPVDVLLSHDVGGEVDIQTFFALAKRGFFQPEKNTTLNRYRLQQVISATQPRFIYHGHYHLDYRTQVHFGDDIREIRGLNCNGTRKKSYFIVNLKPDDSNVVY